LPRPARAALLILLLLPIACAAPLAPTETPATPVPTWTAARPTASPTPAPELLLVGEFDSDLAAALEAWAGERGWVVRRSDVGQKVPVDETAAPETTGPGVASPNTAAAVLTGPGGEAALPGLAAAGVPVVAVDIESAAPAQSVSTVGRPGARYDEAAFLAGALAGLISPTGSVGLIADPGAEQQQRAFLHGLRYLCVRCEVVSLDPAGTTVDGFRAKAADVVAVLPGPTAGTAAQALVGAGFWLVLVDQPDGPYLPDEVAARVAFEPEAMVIAALEALLAGQPGQAWPYSAQLDSLRVVEIHPQALSAGRLQAIGQLLQALAAGLLDPGVEAPGP
jgi:hypothetical protein